MSYKIIRPKLLQYGKAGILNYQTPPLHSKRQEKHKLTPRPAAKDGTVQDLILSLSRARDSALSPGTLSPRQQFAESLTVAEVLESSNRHNTHTRPEINTQASPSSMREEFVSSPLTDTSSLIDFENFDLVDWV